VVKNKVRHWECPSTTSAGGRSPTSYILEQAGLEPAPERERKTTWAEFLKMHWDVMGATDFFTVEVWTLR
jgi:hypothetical protein